MSRLILHIYIYHYISNSILSICDFANPKEASLWTCQHELVPAAGGSDMEGGSEGPKDSRLGNLEGDKESNPMYCVNKCDLKSRKMPQSLQKVS